MRVYGDALALGLLLAVKNLEALCTPLLISFLPSGSCEIWWVIWDRKYVTLMSANMKTLCSLRMDQGSQLCQGMLQTWLFMENSLRSMAGPAVKGMNAHECLALLSSWQPCLICYDFSLLHCLFCKSNSLNSTKAAKATEWETTIITHVIILMSLKLPHQRGKKVLVQGGPFIIITLYLSTNDSAFET